jgi:hypothetical protein
MFPDGTSGLVSCAEAGVIEQAKHRDAAADSRVWNMGAFMRYGRGVIQRANLALYPDKSFLAVAASPGPSIP